MSKVKAEIIEIKTPEKIKALVEQGIPLSLVRFHASVNDALMQPNSQYNIKSQNKSRAANMWLCPGCIILEQNGVYFGSALANAIDWKFKV